MATKSKTVKKAKTVKTAAKKTAKKTAKAKNNGGTTVRYVKPEKGSIREKLYALFVKHKGDHIAAKEAAIKAKINPATAAKQLWLMKHNKGNFAARRHAAA
jgi:hypothetical protein